TVAPFSLDDVGFVLSGGQTGFVDVTFTPLATGTFTSAVIFGTSAGNSTNAVFGSAVTPAQIAVSPGGFNFGTVAVGSNLVTTFTVTNQGGAGMNNGLATVTGGPFSILSGSPFSLPGFGSTNVVVSFAPGSAATFSN